MFKALNKRLGICPVCEQEREIVTGQKKETIRIRNEDVDITAQLEHCASCGEYFADSDMEEQNIQQAYRAYRAHHGFMQPEEIRAVREEYQLSQRALSRLLGWGEITLHRYEAGGLQDEAHNVALMLVQEPESMRILLEKNGNRIPKRMLERAMRRLDERQADSLVSHIAEPLVHKKKDEFSGYKAFDTERFRNAILYFTSAPDVRLFKTSVNKLLWYFDSLVYKETGVSATGCVYVHDQWGPVPERYWLLLDALIESKDLTPIEVVFDRGEDISGTQLVANKKPELSVFADEEKYCLELVLRKLGSLGARKLSDLSHDELAYKHTRSKQRISYELAKQLKAIS